MANTIQIKRKSTAGAPTPGVLSEGEMCYVLPDEALYIKNSAATVTLINAAGVGFAMTTVEKNLGTVPRLSGSFQITGLSGLTPGDHVLIVQAPGPYTGKGTLADESSDMVMANGYVLSATVIQVYWQSVKSPMRGNIKFNYKIL